MRSVYHKKSKKYTESGESCMRSLVIIEIKHLIEKGCSEIDTDYLEHLRGTKLDHTAQDYSGNNVPTDLDKFLAQLYDPELLLILRDLHCEVFR